MWVYMGGCRDLIVGFGDTGFRVSAEGAEVGDFSLEHFDRP